MLRDHFYYSSISKLFLVLLILLALLSNPVFSGNQTIGSSHASILNQDKQNITLSFEFDDVVIEQKVENGNSRSSFSLPEEGHTLEHGYPVLPSVTRVVIVPPNAGLRFSYTADEPRVENAERLPVIFTDENQLNQHFQDTPPLTEIYPPIVAAMSEPFIIRGVRMVRITTYPVRYDPVANTYLHYDNVETEIRFTNDEPVNPVNHPVRCNRSVEFLKFIEAYALNGSDIRRDDPGKDQVDRKPGHYLIVTHEECLQFVAPFIEWRRKGGYKVEIMAFNRDEALNPDLMLREVQESYDAYVEQGIDPFDHILLVGDRREYVGAPRPQWVLESFEGESVWGGGPNHADYLYACLEGNDVHMDAAISRFPAGNPETLALVVNRTLSYEAEPFMEDRAWFTRGTVFTQHCGNGQLTYWTPYLHTITRWGEEVLRRHGFDDIAVYDNMDYDQRGDQVNPFLCDVFNEGRNVIVGTGNTFNWRNEFQGINNNVIFPIYLNFSEHSRMAGYTMFRTGNGNQLKGPVASTSTWGDWGNVEPICVQWLGLVSSFINHDMTLGWSRVYAVTDLESYFPNVDVGRDRPLYQQAKTDFDFMGDPGIQAWIGVPRLVEAELSLVELSPTTSYVEVNVTDVENGEPVVGARVSLYAPGEIPAFNNADYADYDEMWQMTLISDVDGRAGFHIDPEVEFQPDTQLNYTVTGRDIRPFFGEVEIEGAPVAIEVTNFEFVEVDGNGDAGMNPGETFALQFLAWNLSDEEDINGVTAIVSSSSDCVEVDENEIDLGDIAAADRAEFEEGVNFVLATDCPDGAWFSGECPLLQVEFTSGDRTWISAVEIDPVAPAFRISEIVGGDQITFDDEELNLEIENIGRMVAGELTVELQSTGRSISILQDESVYPNIEVGERARLEGDIFQINVNPQTIPGINVDLLLLLTAENGFNQQIPFTVQIDLWGGGFPQAPDDYGYICFDDTDEDWDLAPAFEWIEISLNEDERDFDGVLLDFEGESEFDIGEAIVLDLPFETQFYGEVFNQITVCTKGFIAMGNQPRVTNYQPSPLDRAMGGGTGMIAPFWGDLAFEDNTGIYFFYDEEDAQFIIEWYQTSHLNEERENLTFQVIMYDPEVWITETGDPNILFQYQSISDLRNLRDVEWLQAIPFAAVGISSPDGTTGVNYSFNNTLPESSAPLEDGRAILFSTAFEQTVGRIFGTVTDLETGEPIEGARIHTMHGFLAVSDEEGNWEIPGALADIAFSITCSAPGYNDLTIGDLWVEEGEDLEINFELLHPEFECSIDNISRELEEGDVANVQFELANNGNGPLEWDTEAQWQGGGDLEPWELIRQYPVGEILEDVRLQGVVFVNDRFYVAGSNNRDPQIYILNREGELLEQFPQFGRGGYGHKDMAFDGEWIWGSGLASIFAFTPEGELMREFRGPFNPNNNFAWDTDRELLWVSSTTSNILALDREGNQVLELNRMGLRVYGLCYFPEDPDGFPLYIFHKQSDFADQIITKMNPETNDTMFVAVLEPEGGGNPSAAFCTNELDIMSWVFVCMSNNGPNDRIDVWQMANRFEWFDLEPEAGIVEAGESQDLIVTLDARGLPMDFRLEVAMIFHHNAIEGEFILPISLEVLGENRILRIDLLPGWNIASINVEPENLDVREITRPLVDAGELLILKNGMGEFYLPAQDFCNIDGWEVSEGYQVNVTEETQLEVPGAIIPADQPIPLRDGWNMSGYYPRQAVDARVALVGIVDNLVLAKDGLGRFYFPEVDFSNMGNLEEGQGYQYNMREATELIYRLAGEELALAIPESVIPTYYGVVSPTGADMSMLLSGNPEMNGQEIGVLTSGGLLVGTGVINEDGYCGIAVWGDDVTSEVIEGAVEGQNLSFIHWNGYEEKEIIPTLKRGESVWNEGGLMVGEIDSEVSAPVTFGIHETYPNPTNGPVRLSFGLENDGIILLRVYDLSGRKVATLAKGEFKTGNHQIVWNTDVVSSGLYIVKLSIPGRSQSDKIAVLK